jgi:hypothetical protein
MTRSAVDDGIVAPGGPADRSTTALSTGSTEDSMRSAYKYVGFAIPVLVAIQAMAIAVAVFGLASYNQDHALPKDMEGSNTTFTGDFGFGIHAMGGMLIVLVTLVLLVVSFFARDVPGARRWGALAFGDAVLQYALALVSFSAPIVGMLHGLNALILFGLGIMAGRAALVKEPERVAV